MRATALFALLLLIAFWPLFLLGQPIASAHELRLRDAVYRAEALPALAPGLQVYVEALGFRLLPSGIYDPAFLWIDLPNDSLLGELFRAGEWPLWNPFNAMGTPLLATGQAAPFFPLKLLLYLGHLTSGYSLFLVLRLLLAAVFSYAFVRAVGLSHSAGLLAGVGYMFSGYLITHLHNIDATPPAVLPLWLWAVERLCARRDARALGTAGVSLGTLALSGHPETALYAGVAGGTYGLARVGLPLWGSSASGRERKGALTGLLLLLGAAALGAGIAAVMLLPVLERLRLAAGALLHGGVQTSWADAGRTALVPLLLHLLTPLAAPQAQYNAYVGPLALLLTAVALLDNRMRRRVAPLAVMGGVTLLLFLVSRESEVFRVLPFGLNAFYNVPPLAFAVAALAGAGLDVLIAEARLAGGRTALRRAAWPAVFLLAVAVALWDLSHDERRPAGMVALLPLLALALPLAWRVAGAFGRRATGAWPAPRRLRRLEAWCVAGGLALAAGAAGADLAARVYGTWVGQAMSGPLVGPAGPAQVWWARGRLATGDWRLNRDRTDATVLLPPHETPGLIWWDSGRRPQPVSDVALDPVGRRARFAVGGETFEGRLTGGFHHYLWPAAGAGLVIELALAIGAAALLAVWRRGAALGAGVVGLTALSLTTLTAARNPPLPPFEFPRSGALAWLEANAPGERVAPIGGGVLVANTNVLHRMPSVSLQDPIAPCRYQIFLGALSEPGGRPACGGQHLTTLDRLDAGALRLTGAAYAVARSDGDVPAPADAVSGLEPVFRDAGARIYRVLAPAPRATVVTQAVVFPRDDPAVLGAAVDPGRDPLRSVVLETSTGRAPAPLPLPDTWPPGPACDARSPSLPGAPAVPTATDAPAGSATVVSERANELRVGVTAPAGGYLVLRDSDFPGWQAFVDGVRAPLCRADYLFRAVPLPPGASEVRFHYRPLSFGLGLGLLSGAGAAAAVLLAWPLRSVEGRTPVRNDAVALVGWTLLLALALTLAGFAPWLPRG